LPFAYGASYNEANQRITVTMNDGSYWVYEYDTLGQITSAKKHFADGTFVLGISSKRICGNHLAGLSPEVPPSGRGVWGGASVRRYVSLRETHPRLCTFASPRRVPTGHGDGWEKSRVMRWAWNPPDVNLNGEKPRVRIEKSQEPQRRYLARRPGLALFQSGLRIRIAELHADHLGDAALGHGDAVDTIGAGDRLFAVGDHDELR